MRVFGPALLCYMCLCVCASVCGTCVFVCHTMCVCARVNCACVASVIHEPRPYAGGDARALSQWVSGRLMSLLGMSNGTLVDYVIALAAKAKGPDAVASELAGYGLAAGAETDAFARELFSRAPRRGAAPAARAPARVTQADGMRARCARVGGLPACV